MALPKLNNDNPVYEMIVPSTKKTVKFRPFLVKEQKNLLIALEAQDGKQMLNAMLSCLESCVSDVNVKELATFDIDYMFTMVRSKSVGETSMITSSCNECEHENKISIDLSKIEMDTNNIISSTIPINDQISVKMKYPTYEDMMNNEKIFDDDSRVVDVLFETIITCIHSVQTEEENIMVKDEPREEVERFISSLTNEQLNKITAFVDSMPTLSHMIEYNCENCNTHNQVELKGLQDFF
jgi:hypothetical protein